LRKHDETQIDAEVRTMDRGQFTKRVAVALGVTAGAAMSGRWTRGVSAGLDGLTSDTLTIVSYGGSYGDTFKKTIIDPFTRATGIKVNLLPNTSLAGLQLQEQSHHVRWDLPELSGAEFQTAIKKNLILPYNYSKIRTSKVLPQFKSKYGIREALFIFGMAWNTNAIPEANAPRSWADFWNTKRYPGKRSLYDNLTDGAILEAALMADGVPITKLYPLDVDRALRSLDKLGKQNIIWHSTNQEPIQQLSSGAVNLATSYNGRVRLARTQEHAPLNFSARQGVVGSDYLVVPRGAHNAATAWRFLDFMFNNDAAGAAFTRATGYPISNTGIAKKLPASYLAELPGSPTLKGLTAPKNDKWWSDNLESASQKFKEWQLR
jgi:putative spermidine/putrescine transport system substrate-binding protein